MEQGYVKASSSAKATAGKEEHRAKGKVELAVSSMQLTESKGELAVSSLQLAESIEHRAEGKVELAVSSMQLTESKGELAVSSMQLAESKGELAVSSLQLAESNGELAVSSMQLAESIEQGSPSLEMELRRPKAESKGELAVSSMQLAESIEHRAEGKIPAYLDAAEPIGAERSSSRSPLGEIGAERSAVSTPWLVVKTKTKCEKYVRDKIQAMGIEAFVPVTRRTARYQRKVKVYEYPLISCYTFVRLDRSRRNQVLSLPYVQGMLRLNGKDCQVTTQEIRWLQQVSGSAMDIAAETWSVQTGDHVMIAAGQLAGMEGIILSRRSKHEVVLGLESLGLQLVIQVDPAMLVRV